MALKTTFSVFGLDAVFGSFEMPNLVAPGEGTQAQCEIFII